MFRKRILGAILALGMVFGTMGTSRIAFANSNEAPTQFKNESKLSISEVVEQNKAAVVTVAVRKIVNGGLFGNAYQEGVGSGFFIDSKGYIATNYHVVAGASEVNIILYDGTEIPGQVVWNDENNDLAIVQIDSSRYTVPGVVTIGNSDEVRVGEQVIAIGNPMSVEFAGTVTAGIISAKDREIDMGGGKRFKYFQTDAAINGGNSGGPLFNSSGQVIGINSAKIAQMEIEGISFAIPINTLMDKMNQKPETSGQTNEPTSIGVTVKDVTEPLAAQFNVPQGVMIMEVQKGSAASEGGLLPGDIITHFADQRITTTVQLNTVKSKFKAGDTVNIRIFRESDGKEYEGQITLRPAR